MKNYHKTLRAHESQFKRAPSYKRITVSITYTQFLICNKLSTHLYCKRFKKKKTYQTFDTSSALR